MQTQPGGLEAERRQQSIDLGMQRENTRLEGRHYLVRGLSLGHASLFYAANAPEASPKLQGQASVHRLLVDSLTAHRPFLLTTRLQSFASDFLDQTYVPSVHLDIPRHDREGNPVEEHGTQKHTGIYVRFPLPAITQQLEMDGERLPARMLIEAGQPYPNPPQEELLIKDLVRLVADRMARRHNQNPITSWVASEKAVREAIAGPVFALPKVH